MANEANYFFIDGLCQMLTDASALKNLTLNLYNDPNLKLTPETFFHTFGHTRNLQTLTLNSSFVPELWNEPASLGTLLGNNPQLMMVRLSLDKYTAEGITTILEGLTNLNQVRSFALSGENLTGTAVQPVLSFLQRNEDLESIQIEASSLTEGESQGLIESISSQSLLRITLSSLRLNEAGQTALIELLEKNEGIKGLSLYGASLTEERLKAVIRAVCNKPEVIRIDATNIPGMKSDVIQNLITWFKETRNEREHTSLSIMIGDKDWTEKFPTYHLINSNNTFFSVKIISDLSMRGKEERIDIAKKAVEAPVSQARGWFDLRGYFTNK